MRVLVGQADSDFVEINGLHIAFSVAKTSGRHPNKAKITIMNLDPDNAARLENAARSYVQLFAGYKGRESLIFQGEIRKGKAQSAWNGADRITTIEASDGADIYRSARINKSYSGQVSAKLILDDVINSFGVNVKSSRDAKELIKRLPNERMNDFVAAGRSADIMDQLGQSFGFDWRIEDGVLKINQVNSDTGESAILITGDNGLVNAPKKTNKGVDVTTLLNPKIRPKRIVELRTPDVEGFFRVQTVEHKGDSGFGNEFYTMLETVQVGGRG